MLPSAGSLAWETGDRRKRAGVPSGSTSAPAKATPSRRSQLSDRVTLYGAIT